MIRVNDLRVDYDNLCAVRDLSFQVEPGQICGLIGPNGAGKTSTMKAIIGLIEPTYGEIELAGVDMREHPRGAARFVGYMPDAPPLYEDLYCWEFLDLFAASYGIAREARPAVVRRAMYQVGLEDKHDEPTGGLSRGMRQRLMLAKTLIPDPQVLILDEPASGVDPQGRIDLRNILKQQAALGKTVLISSHILTEMTEFCTAVAVMERGRMVVSGKIEEVHRRVMGASLLAVEVIGPPEPFLEIIGQERAAGPVIFREGRHEFRFAGNAEAAADLLARLVGAGVRVSSFSRRKEGLEELFMKLGAKRLS